MAAPKTLVLEISPALEKRLSAVATAKSQSYEDVAQEALAGYLDLFDWQLEAIREGLREAEAGKLVDHHKVAAWLESWGDDRELASPPCD